MKKLHILKIGGNVIDDDNLLSKFLQDFVAINAPKILIHGGGKFASDLAEKLKIPQAMVEGRRITNAETLDLTVMVYAGLINKKIVAKLQSLNCDALGLSGADGDLVKAEKRNHASIDFGNVGDIEEDGVSNEKLSQLLELGFTPVFSAITHDGKGGLLNTNADTMASAIAISMSEFFEVNLTYCFEKKGVLLDVNDENSILNSINEKEYQRLKENKIISNGMIPKLDNAFEAIGNGVKEVKICHAKDLNSGGTILIKSNIYVSPFGGGQEGGYSELDLN